MSTRYHRHFAHTGHNNSPRKRQQKAPILKDMFVWDIDENDNRDGVGEFPLTTTTVVRVLPGLSTPIPSYSVTFQSDSLASTSSETTTTVTIIDINTLPSPIRTSSISLASTSTTPSSSTLSPTTISATPLLQGAKALSTSSLNPGAIAGIVITCVFAFFIGMFFAIRIWFKKKRASKLRKIWLRSSVGMRGADAPESSYEPKFPLRNRDSRAVQNLSPPVSVPPISYNNDAVYHHTTSTVSSPPSAFTSPVYSPGLTSVSPYSTIVVCSFIPSLPDELTVRVGETLRVLAEYEDGWSLCMNCRGEQGMVPNECLDRSSSIGLFPPQHENRISRSRTRVSSLAQAIRPGH